MKTTNDNPQVSVTSENDLVVNIGALRRENWPYIFIWVLYYAWVVAFATWWTASPLSETLFSARLRELMHSVNLISSAVFVFILRKQWFVRATRAGALVIIAGMAAFFLVKNDTARLACAIISSVAVGCVNISILMPFVFRLNNTEKLYAVLGSNVLISLISLYRIYFTGRAAQYAVAFPVLALSLGAVLFFKKDTFPQSAEASPGRPKISRRVYSTIFLNCAVAILCKGAGKGVLNVTAEAAGLSALTWYYIGGLAGCLVYFLVYACAGRAFLWLVNITFSSVALGLLCSAFGTWFPGLSGLFALLLGLGGTVGMINMYYIIGVIGKKYDSMRYIRLSILLIGICGGISGVLTGGAISSAGTFEISIIASAVSVAAVIVFMAVSPALTDIRYESEWARDSKRTDTMAPQDRLFSRYGLTRRESEVCRLLLQGYTLRQTSGILSIAYSTVNTYCTSAYRKLGINSRTELLVMFRDFEAQ